MRILNAETGALEARCDCQSVVNSVVFSPSGVHVASGSEDGLVRVWDMAPDDGAASVRELCGHTNSVLCVAYSPDGRHIVSSSWDQTIRVWDARTGEVIGEPMVGHSDLVTSVAYSPDGRCIVSASGDGTMCIWDAATREPIGAPLIGPTLWIYCVVYSPDRRCLVSGSSDGTICVWNATLACEPLSHENISSTTPADYAMDKRSEAEDTEIGQQWDTCLKGIEYGDEWVYDTNGKTRLLWIPPAYRKGLLYRRLITRITNNGPAAATQIDHRKLFQYSGKNWSQIFPEAS